MKQRMTVEEVAEAVGIGARTFTSYVARGQAPKPVGFSPENGRRVWRGTDIEYWMQDRPGRGRRPSTWREHVGMRSPKTTSRKGGADTPPDGGHVPPEPSRKPAKAATKKTAPKNASAAPAAAKASAKTTPAAATKKPSAGKKTSSSSTKKTSSTKKVAAQKPAAARSPRKTSAKSPDQDVN